jgi:hypothetical protein
MKAVLDGLDLLFGRKVMFSKKTWLKSILGLFFVGVFVAVFCAGSVPSVKAEEINEYALLEEVFWNGFNHQRWVLPQDQEPSIALVDVDGNFGVVWVGVLDKQTDLLLQIPATPVPAMFDGATWSLTYPDEISYENSLLQIPNTLISASVLSHYVSSDLSGQSVQNAGYYPWHGDMKVNQDRQNSTDCANYSHCIGGSDEWAWDFGNTTSGWPIYASRGGKIAWINTSWETGSGSINQTWYNVNVIVIDYENGYAGIYMHLAQDLPTRFSINDSVSVGQFIGYADQTGRSTGPHLHFAVQPWDSSWNGNSSPSIWYRHSQESLFNDETPYGNPGNPTYPNWYTSHVENGGSCDATSVPSGYVKCADEGGTCSFSGNKQVYYGANSCYAVQTHSDGVSCNNDVFGDPTPDVGKACYIESSSSSCPSVSGEVRLYDGTNCSGSYTTGDNPGLWNMANTFNDRAESIAIPSNWSTRLYLDDNESSPDKCYSSTDTDFWNDTFSNGTVVANKATYFRIYDNTTCSGSTGSWAYQLYSMGDFNGGDPYESNQSIMDLSSVGWNDRTESIKINSGYEIIACANANLDDPCGRATGPAEYGDINALAQGLRDGLSSIKVCVGSCPTAPNPPSLNSPGDGSYFDDETAINLSWTATGDEYYGEIWGGPGGTLAFGWQSGTSKNIGTQWPGYTYYWHIKAKNSSGLESDWSNTRSFTVEEACTPPSAPPAPGLVYPQDGSTITTTTPTLDWNDISADYCVDYYNIQVFEDGGGQVLSETVGSEYQVPSGKLTIGKSYTWYVWAHNSIGFGNSLIATFDVEPCATPGSITLTSPENNETTASTTPIFYWNASSDSDWYELQYSTNQDFSNSSSLFSTQTINEIWPEELDDGTYYWRVRGQNTTGTCNLFGPWSSSRYFHVVTSSPDTPSNLHQSSNTQDSISITWNDGFGETGYKIYKWGWDGTEWRFIYHDSVGENITSYTDTNLTCGADYYWYEISANNNYGESGHTNFIQGTTDACPLNDDFDHAIDLSLHSTVTLDTHGTTQDADDPAIPNCNMNAGRATVWYKYKPSSDSAISLDTKTSNYDSFIAVWTGTRTNLSLVVCNDDIDNANGILQSAVAFRVQKDVTYYIEVGEWDWYYAEASASALGAKEKKLVPTFPPWEMTPEKME